MFFQWLGWCFRRGLTAQGDHATLARVASSSNARRGGQTGSIRATGELARDANSSPTSAGEFDFSQSNSAPPQTQ